MAESLGALRRACEAVDRSPDEIEITCLWPAQGGADAVARYAAAGVGRLLIPLPALGEDSVAGMQAVAADVLGA
jgi:hypothetical protein